MYVVKGSCISVTFYKLQIFSWRVHTLKIGVIVGVNEIEISDYAILHIFKFAPLHLKAFVKTGSVLLTSDFVIYTDTSFAAILSVLQTEVVMRFCDILRRQEEETEVNS